MESQSGEQGWRAKAESKGGEPKRRARVESQSGEQGWRAKAESKGREPKRRARLESQSGEQGLKAFARVVCLRVFAGSLSNPSSRG